MVVDFIGIVGVLWLLLIYPNMPAQQAGATAFDHSNCQYPQRWSNPPNACDNSDPAVPECIKGIFTEAEEKACIDKFVAAYDEATKPSSSSEDGKVTEAAPAATEVQNNGCTGK